jgi:nitroreductase
MDALELLHTRTSNGKLTEPGPDDVALARAFAAAARTPDHGALRPWRIHVVRGQARNALGELFARLEAARTNASAESIEKARAKPLRAPVLLVVSAKVVANPKVPAVEQLLAAGLAAELTMLALQAQGFSGLWRTGDPVYSDAMKRAFGLGPADAIVGVLYVGTAKQPPPEQRRPAPAEFVSEWTGSLDAG